MATAFAQNDLNFTAQMSNGRYWNTLDDTAKIFYLVGLRDHLMSTGYESGDPKKYIRESWAAGFVLGDYMKEFDALYKDAENTRIPIPWAFMECTQKLKGTGTKEALEQRLIGVRKLVAAMK